MKFFILLSALLLVAMAAENSGKHRGTRAPPTEEQKAQWEAKKKEELAKLSPEAQAVAEKINAIIKSEKDKIARRKAIETLLAGVSKSVRKEVEEFYHGKGHGPRRTTIKA